MKYDVNVIFVGKLLKFYRIDCRYYEDLGNDVFYSTTGIEDNDSFIRVDQFLGN